VRKGDYRRREIKLSPGQSESEGSADRIEQTENQNINRNESEFREHLHCNVEFKRQASCLCLNNCIRFPCLRRRHIYTLIQLLSIAIHCKLTILRLRYAQTCPLCAENTNGKHYTFRNTTLHTAPLSRIVRKQYNIYNNASSKSWL
jgi:hypothetical protein